MSQSSTPTTFTVNSDSDVKEYVRSITEYEDSPNELPDGDLNTQIALAKGDIGIEYDLSQTQQPWFSDIGLGMALIYGCAIYCKLSVENYSVSSWTFGDETISTKNIPPDESAQILMWKKRVDKGLDNSDSTSTHTPGPSLTFDPNW